MFNPNLTVKRITQRHRGYEVVCKATGEVVCTDCAYAPLEKEYADHGHLYFIRNAQTGVEWDIPA